MLIVGTALEGFVVVGVCLLFVTFVLFAYCVSVYLCLIWEFG